MSKQINFNKQELKQFTNISPQELSDLLQDKTDNEYIVIQKQMVKDITNRLLNNMLHIGKISDVAFKSWENIIKENREIMERWNLSANDFN